MGLPVQIKVLDDRIGSEFLFPTYATNQSAGIDLVACIDEPITLRPSAPAQLIPTGIAVFVDNPNYASVILPRSGLGHKKGLVLGNGTGLIDADYQGQLFMSAWNRNDLDFVPTLERDYAGQFDNEGDALAEILKQRDELTITINPGDCIAQLVFVPIARAEFEIVQEFEQSARGEGGFGHSGVSRVTKEVS